MSRRKRSFRPGLWLLLAGLITLLVFANRPSQPLQVRRLPDGSTLSLEAITYGPQHRFVPGGKLAGLLASLLPRPLGYWTGLGAFEKEVRPDPSVPVVWTVRRGAAPGTSAFQHVLGDMADWTIFDEHGCERPAAELATYHTGGRTQVVSFALRTFPRRGTWVGLRMYGPNREANRKPVAEFRLPNPDPGPHPDWKTQPLPVSVRDGDLECTLQQFTNGGDSRDPTRATQMGRVFGSSAFIQVASRFLGKGATRWTPIDVTYADATGNRYERQGMGRTSSHANKSRLWAPGMLPFCEPAWKVEVELARTPDSPFRPEELWTVENIPAPDWGQIIDINRSTKIGKIEVSLRGFARGTPTTLNARLDTGEPGYHLTLVKMVDDRGRPVVHEPDWTSWWRTNNGWASYDYAMRIRGGARTLTATFALQKTRVVEFLAAPKHLLSPPARQ